MIKTTISHEPEGFHFWMLSEGGIPAIADRQFQEFRAQRFLLLGRAIAVSVVSEFTEIPITVEFDRFGPDPITESSWDRIVECPLAVGSKAIVFESAVGDEFGRLEVPSGLYRLRICYGGQNTRQHSGESADFYLIQIWPSKDTSTKIIKP